MPSLEGFRERINEIDSRIIDALIERTQIVSEVGAFKKENKMKIVDRKREKELISARIRQAEGKLNPAFVKKLFETIIKSSRNEQKRIIRKKS